MGGSTSQTSTVQASGNNGVELLRQKHTDIDESRFSVQCTSGACRIGVEERIWFSWIERESADLSAGGSFNRSLEVDSDAFDADHRLIIIAKANGTQVNGSWTSTDR